MCFVFEFSCCSCLKARVRFWLSCRHHPVSMFDSEQVVCSHSDYLFMKGIEKQEREVRLTRRLTRRLTVRDLLYVVDIPESSCNSVRRERERDSPFLSWTFFCLRLLWCPLKFSTQKVVPFLSFSSFLVFLPYFTGRRSSSWWRWWSRSWSCKTKTETTIQREHSLYIDYKRQILQGSLTRRYIKYWKEKNNEKSLE